jgi:hypothetical protein
MQPVWPPTEVLGEGYKGLKEALARGEADQIEVAFAAVAPGRGHQRHARDRHQQPGRQTWPDESPFQSAEVAVGVAAKPPSFDPPLAQRAAELLPVVPVGGRPPPHKHPGGEHISTLSRTSRRIRRIKQSRNRLPWMLGFNMPFNKHRFRPPWNESTRASR